MPIQTETLNPPTLKMLYCHCNPATIHSRLRGTSDPHLFITVNGQLNNFILLNQSDPLIVA